MEKRSTFTPPPPARVNFAVEGRQFPTEEALRAHESQLATEAAALARLNEAGSRLWRAPTLRAGLEEMLAATIELLGAAKGNVQILDAEKGVLHIAAHRGFEQDFLDFFREVSAKDDSCCGRTLRGGKRVVIEDVETDAPFAPFRPVARAAGYRAVQSTPLIGRDGTPLGIISTHFQSPHRPSDHELRLLDLYVRQAADFIEWKRAEDKMSKLNTELARRTAELEDAMREHVDIYTAISHNLHAPLRALQCYSTLLLSGAAIEMPTADRDARLKDIGHNASLMGRYIDDLLAFNELYRAMPKPEWCVAVSAAHDAWDALALKRIHRTVTFACGELPDCQADPLLLKEIFLLLLSNAIKFSKVRDEAHIEVGGRVEEGPGGKRTVFWVRDNGMGFDMRFERRIFGLFQRLNWTEDYSGTGCGLSLAQRIVQRHGGRVWAEAEVDKGATFYFELPERALIAPSPAAPSEPSSVG